MSVAMTPRRIIAGVINHHIATLCKLQRDQQQTKYRSSHVHAIVQRNLDIIRYNEVHSLLRELRNVGCSCHRTTDLIRQWVPRFYPF